MKKSLLALAIAAASLPAFAQVGADSASSAGASASTGNIGITSIMNLPGANPFTSSNIGYSGGYTTTVKGQPVAAGAASFATPAVWRCATAGAGAALQLKDFAFSLALPGGESAICPREFRIAIIGGIYDRALLAEKSDLSAEQKKIAKDALASMHAEACGDDEMANSFEHSENFKCKEPITTDDRKARWAREREQKQRASVDMVTGLPIVASAPAAPRQPRQPWQSGG